MTKKFSKSLTSPLSDSKFKKSLQSVVNNVKDWDGQRLMRKSKPINKNPQTPLEP